MHAMGEQDRYGMAQQHGYGMAPAHQKMPPNQYHPLTAVHAMGQQVGYGMAPHGYQRNFGSAERPFTNGYNWPAMMPSSHHFGTSRPMANPQAAFREPIQGYGSAVPSLGQYQSPPAAMLPRYAPFNKTRCERIFELPESENEPPGMYLDKVEALVSRIGSNLEELGIITGYAVAMADLLYSPPGEVTQEDWDILREWVLSGSVPLPQAILTREESMAKPNSAWFRQAAPPWMSTQSGWELMKLIWWRTRMGHNFSNYNHLVTKCGDQPAARLVMMLGLLDHRKRLYSIEDWNRNPAKNPELAQFAMFFVARRIHEFLQSIPVEVKEKPGWKKLCEKPHGLLEERFKCYLSRTFTIKNYSPWRAA